MNNLHRDLLNESTSDFRNHLLQAAVATSRRARRTRAVAKTSATVALLILAFLILVPPPRDRLAKNIPAQPSSASFAMNPRGYAILHTEPFANILRTEPLPPRYLVDTPSPIRILDNTTPPAITPISDDQLLALFAGEPVALVAGALGEELIFVETEPPISN